MAERSRSSALDSSSGVVRMWVRIPAWPVAALVLLSKTLNHNCFVLRMGRKAVGPVCCVMHVKEPRTLIAKEKGLSPVFLNSRLEHPAGWICARYKSSVLLCIISIIHLPTHLYPHPCPLLPLLILLLLSLPFPSLPPCSPPPLTVRQLGATHTRKFHHLSCPQLMRAAVVALFSKYSGCKSKFKCSYEQNLN